MFYCSDGIIRELHQYNGFYLTFHNDRFIYDKEYTIINLDSELVLTYDIFRDKIFNDTDRYYETLPSFPMWLRDAGHSSDCSLGKREFEQLVGKITDEDYFKYLYLVDCQALIGSVQDRIIMSKNHFVDFFIEFCSIQLHIWNKDSVFYTSGNITSKLFGAFYTFIITLYSSLDILTKVIYELQNIKTAFLNYPKLSSHEILFKPKFITGFDNQNTIYEDDCDNIKLLINLRNEIVHNASLEDNPKIYYYEKNSKIEEKWILLPDFENGNLMKYVNRKHFFAQEKRLNLILPDLYLDIVNRIDKTVKAINTNYSV